MEKQKQKSFIKKEGLKNRMLIGLTVLTIFLMLPGVYAYSLGLPALDLYTALVEYIFGSFWIAVFAVMGVLFFMMAILGGLSSYTVLTYNMFFFFAISIGYSRLFAVLIFLWCMVYFVFQAVRTGNQASY